MLVVVTIWLSTNCLFLDRFCRTSFLLHERCGARTTKSKSIVSNLEYMCCFILLFNLYLQFSVISPFICESPISSQGIHRSLLVPTDLSIWLSKLSKERDRWGIKREIKDSNKYNRKSEKYHSIKNFKQIEDKLLIFTPTREKKIGTLITLQ